MSNEDKTILTKLYLILEYNAAPDLNISTGKQQINRCKLGLNPTHSFNSDAEWKLPEHHNANLNLQNIKITVFKLPSLNLILIITGYIMILHRMLLNL